MGNDQSSDSKKSAKSPTSESEADVDSYSAASTSVSSSTKNSSTPSGVRHKQSIEDTMGSALNLSSYQMQMLSQSWPRVQQTGGHQVGGHLFRKLSSKSPQCREAFQKLTILEGFSPRGARSVDVYKEHGRLLFELFNDAIKSLNEPAIAIVNQCRDYGSKHSGIMVNPSDGLASSSANSKIWDDLSEILVEHITKMDAVRKHRELSKAWTMLITFLMEKCKDGCRAAMYRKGSSHPSASACGASGVLQLQEADIAEEEATATDIQSVEKSDNNDEDDDEKTMSVHD